MRAAILLLMLGGCIGTSAVAQVTSSKPRSTYDPYAAFAPYPYAAPNDCRPATGSPGPRYWQNRSDYRIDARFDTATRQLSAEERIVYKNNSPHTLTYCWLALPQNRFRKDSRAASLTPLKAGRFDIGEYTDGMQIRWFRVRSPQTIVREAVYHLDDIFCKVELPAPLRPGDSVELDMAFSFRLPLNGSDLMGVCPSTHGSIFAFSSWYPTMEVFDDLKGWNLQGDLADYSDAGTVDYRITLPANMVVGGSGQLQNPGDVLSGDQANRLHQAAVSDSILVIRSRKEMEKECEHPAAGVRTWHFRIQCVGPVNWAASAGFIWDGVGVRIPGGRRATAMSLYPAEASKEFCTQSTATAKKALEFYSRQWFPYPFATMVNIGCGITGLEGPGVSFIPFDAGTGHGGVVAKTNHEIGHTWFPFVVAANGMQPWMSEGCNTFINDVNGDSLHVETAFYADQAITNWMARRTKGDPILTPMPQIDMDGFSMTSYVKPAMTLRILRNDILGPTRFDEAFRSYISDWAGKHPTPDDFFRSMNNAAGEDLGWFWRSWFQQDCKLDQAVDKVAYAGESPSHGVNITLANLGEMPMPVTVEVREFNGTVGRVRLPAQIWIHGAEWTFHYPSTSPLIAVILDPDRHYPDVDRNNNRWTGTFKTARAQAGITAESVLSRYFEALGGKERLQGLRNISWTMANDDQDPFYLIRSFNTPAQFSMEALFPARKFQLQKLVVKDTTISSWFSGRPIPILPSQKERFRYATLLFPELEWMSPGYTIRLDDSLAYIGNIETYVIHSTNRMGDEWTDWFDVKTGYKVHQRRSSGPQFDIPYWDADFSEYRLENGFMLPHTLIICNEERDQIMRTKELRINIDEPVK